MTRKRIALTVAGSLVGLVVILAVAAIFVLRSQWFNDKVRQKIVDTVETATGGRAEVGSFHFDWKHLRATVRGFVLHGTEPAGKPPLFRADSIVVGLKIVSILKRDIDIESLDINSPRIYLTIDQNGHTNIPSPKVSSPSGSSSTTETLLKLAVGRFRVQDGMFEVESRGKYPFDANGRNLTADLGYELIAQRYRGTVSIQPLDLRFADYAPAAVAVNLALTLESNHIGIDSANFATGGSTLRLSGSVDDLRAPHGAFQYTANVEVADAGRILRNRALRAGTVRLDGRATFAGTSDYSVTGNLHLYGARYRDVSVAFDNLRADGAIQINPRGAVLNSLRFSSLVTASGKRAPVSGKVASISLRGRNLTARDVAVAGLGGSFRGQAELRNFERFSVAGDLSGFDVRRLVALYSKEQLPWDGRIAGRVGLEGSLRRKNNLRATVSLTISPAQTGPPIQGQITANYDAATGILDLGHSTLQLPATRIEASGAIGRQMQVHLETRDLNDLAPVMGQNGGALPVKLDQGAIVFDGTVTGRLPNPTVAGHLGATRVAYSGQMFDSIQADVEAAPDLLRIQNGAVTSGTARAQFHGSLALQQWKPSSGSQLAANAAISNLTLADLMKATGMKAPVTGTLNGSAQVNGTVGNPLVKAQVEVVKGEAEGEPFDRFSAQVNTTGQTVQLTAGEIVAGPKQIHMTATFDHNPGNFGNGRLQFQVSSNVMALDQIQMLARNRPGVKGTVQLTANGVVDVAQAGGRTQLRLTDFHTDVAARSVEMNGQALGNAHLTANSQGSVLRAHIESDFAGSTIQGEGQWRLEDSYPGTATLHFSKIDLATLRTWISPGAAHGAIYAGSVEGQVQIDGPALRPDQWTAELRIPQFEIRPANTGGLGLGASTQFALRNSGPIVVKLAKSAITVESAHLQGNSTDLNVTGTILIAQKNQLDLRVRGQFGLAALKDFNPDIFASGALVADATVRGALSAPQVNGRLQLQDAALSFADFPTGLSNAKGVILFSGNRATIQSLTGETGGGTIQFTGFAGYESGQAILGLHGEAKSVRVRYPAGVSTVFDASLDLTGTSERSMLAGTVTILRTGFNPQSDLGSLLAGSAQPVRTPAARPGFLGGMNFDVQITTSPDIQFQSSLTEGVQAEANLRLRGTVSNPALLGRINITQGQVIFYGTKYTISQGSISFYNPVRIEPIVNIDLETKARGIDITLTVSGPLNHLVLTPRSDPPLQFNEIVALLATGRAPTSDPSQLTQQSNAPQSWQQMGASMLLGQAIANPVSGRLQRFFGVSKLRIDPTLPGVENNPQARITLEQQVTPDITFTYITNVTSSNPQVVSVEWAFSRRWSVVALREENGLFGIDFFFKRRF
ncbi:MAG TPA: translocation/assembly module TamB domain-containing protein [Bryobacteraceae bacterium]|nr:translocation/assembly module TamB domain-containing protein [Bryobacteraceae bacterium]